MNDKLKKLWRYIFPSMGGLFVTYLYNVVDGIFVGQGVGAAALGAVNVGVPFITFAVAVAAMFPMGGATVAAIRMGRGDRKGANHAFMASVALTLLVSVLLTAAGMLFCGQIIGMSGGRTLSGAMRDMATDYLFYYCAFSVPMLMSPCLSVFVRNDGSPTLSFVGMCVGAGANIFLDWLFIFPMNMGVTGAAIASGLGQVFSVAVLLSHFVRRRGSLCFRRFHLSGALAVKICKRGVPEAVSQLTTPVTALCYNLMLANLAGDIGVSTFSVLSFICSLANAILSGVAQGLQPLWGNCCGERDTDGMHMYFRWGIRINAILSVAIYGLLLFFTEPVIRIFNQDPELVQNASTALPLFSLSFIPMALNLIYTAFLYSTKHTLQADAISFSRGVVLKAAAIFCLPVLLGGDAIWLAPLAAELLTPYLMAKNMFDELAESAFSANTLRGMMNTDIKESDQGYELDIDLPGVHKENLAAELKDGCLCISATVEQTHNDSVQNERYLRRERFIGSCRRSFYVGDKVKQEDIHAKFEDGILRLFIPKVSQVAQIEQKNLIAIEG